MDTLITLTPQELKEVYQVASAQMRLPETIIEKDFWVCWVLREIFALPDADAHFTFKGGTSLSKVWNAIARFSEDVDLAVSREWLGFTNANDPAIAPSAKRREKMLDALQTACVDKLRNEFLPALQTALARRLGTSGWTLSPCANTPPAPPFIEFNYPTVFSTTADAYNRPNIKIEFAPRAANQPSESVQIRPYLANLTGVSLKNPHISLKALSIRRTFWEKATILHAEAHRAPDSPVPSRYSRHYADLIALAKHPVAIGALAERQLLEEVVKSKRLFFHSAWSRYDLATPGTFKLLPSERHLSELADDYRKMRDMYFETPTPWTKILTDLQALETKINAQFQQTTSNLTQTTNSPR
jgi:hypothetical protein